jgi:FkbM family methyltransferase
VSEPPPRNSRLTPEVRFGGREFRLVTTGGYDYYFDHLTSQPPPAVHVAAALCADDAVIVDVGASFGLCTLPFSIVACNGYVIAIEPAPRIAADLRASLTVNAATNVEVLAVALGAGEGSAVLFGPRWNASTAFISQGDSAVAAVHKISPQVDVSTVPVTSLDRVIEDRRLSRLDFVKIDAEGYESAVLEGSTYALAKYHPVCVIEFNPFTLSVMASENPLDFLVNQLRTFSYVHGVDGGLNVERIETDSDAYGVVQRCFNTGTACDLICSWQPLPRTLGNWAPMFSRRGSFGSRLRSRARRLRHPFTATTSQQRPRGGK